MKSSASDSVRKNVAYLFGGELSAKLLNLCSFSLMARGFSVEDYGVLALAFSIGSMFYIFFNFGLDYHLIRDIKEARFEPKDIFSRVANIKIWSLPLFLAIFLIAYFLMGWELSHLVVTLFVFLYFYLASTLSILFFFFRAYENMKYECVTKLIHGLILLACASLFGYMQKNLFLLGLSYLSLTLVVLLLFLLFFVKKFGFSFRFRPFVLRGELAMVGESKYLFFTGICTSIFSCADVWIISFFLGLGAVAVYKNAVLITFASFMLPAVVMQALFPRLVKHRFESASFWNEMRNILKKTVPTAVFIGAILFLLAPFIITFLFGAKYDASIPLFRISLLAFLFSCVNHVFGYGITAAGEYRLAFIIAFILAGFSAVLNLILIPRVGLIGATIALNATQFLAIILPLLALTFKRNRMCCIGDSTLPSDSF
jgi:O-antigen/teichoic acid export membrane protein